MRRIIIFLCAVFLIVGIFGSANAALVPIGNVIWDQENSIYWWRDLSDFVSLSYEDQLIEIAGKGSGWSMASGSEIFALWENHSLDDIARAFGHTESHDCYGCSGCCLSYFGRYDLSNGPGLHHYTPLGWDLRYGASCYPLPGYSLSDEYA